MNGQSRDKISGGNSTVPSFVFPGKKELKQWQTPEACLAVNSWVQERNLENVIRKSKIYLFLILSLTPSGILALIHQMLRRTWIKYWACLYRCRKSQRWPLLKTVLTSDIVTLDMLPSRHFQPAVCCDTRLSRCSPERLPTAALPQYLGFSCIKIPQHFL